MVQKQKNTTIKQCHRTDNNNNPLKIKKEYLISTKNYKTIQK